MRKQLAVVGMALALGSVSLSGCASVTDLLGSTKTESTKDTDSKKEKETEAEDDDRGFISDNKNKKKSDTKKKETEAEDDVEDTDETEEDDIEFKDGDIIDTYEEDDGKEESNQYSGYKLNTSMFKHYATWDAGQYRMEIFTNKDANMDAKDIEDANMKYCILNVRLDMGSAAFTTLFNADDDGGRETREAIADNLGIEGYSDADRTIIDGHVFVKVDGESPMFSSADLPDDYDMGMYITADREYLYMIMGLVEKDSADKYMADFIEAMKFNGKETDQDIEDYSSSDNDTAISKIILPEDTEDDNDTTVEETQSHSSNKSNIDSGDILQSININGYDIVLGKTTRSEAESIIKKLGLEETYTGDISGNDFIIYGADYEKGMEDIEIVYKNDKVIKIKVGMDARLKNYNVKGIDNDLTMTEVKDMFGEPTYEGDTMLEYSETGGYKEMEFFWYDGKLSSVTIRSDI